MNRSGMRLSVIAEFRNSIGDCSWIENDNDTSFIGGGDSASVTDAAVAVMSVTRLRLWNMNCNGDLNDKQAGA